MTHDEYLAGILKEQTFASDDQEMKVLRERRGDVEKLLRDKFSGTAISIRWGGAMAKGTMIRQSYDGDMTCYFNHGDGTAGKTLEEIYDGVAKVLSDDYIVDRKTSALRIYGQSTYGRGNDFHIDVVPGRFTDDDKGDVYIHQNAGTKERLKTNLQTHIDHIKDSGVVEAIRMMKLWNVRNGIGAKTFVLELLVVKLIKGKKGKSLSDQLTHVWTEFRDHKDRLAVEDPANPTGNDLKPALDSCRHFLSSIASSTLSNIDTIGWESVFGPLKDKDESKESKAAAVRVAVNQTAAPTRPWCKGA